MQRTHDPAAEYAAAREGAALVVLDERGLLAASGPQRLKFLHDILSNGIQGLAAGQGCRAALMDVKGRQLAWMRVLVTADAVLLETNADRLALLEATLNHYKVGAPVRFATKPIGILALMGPEARRVLAGAGAELAELPVESHLEAAVSGHVVRVARAGDLPARGFVVHAAADALPAVSDALRGAGARVVGRATLDVLRIEEGRAWHGIDVAEENLLHETGLLQEYHSFTKGCYVGQEVVARLEGRGAHVNKKLMGLKLGAPALAGDTVTAADRDVGRVTTAGVSPRLGPIALAYVHRSVVSGATVAVGGVAATVAQLPLAERSV